MHTFTIGDIHGRYDALKEVLGKVSFDYDEDKLIILGDVCDCGKDTYQVVEELLKIKNKVYILGNHDDWFRNHINNGWLEQWWLIWGGLQTLQSYGAVCSDETYIHGTSVLNLDNLKIPQTHKDFFNSGVLYYVRGMPGDKDGIDVFVHGGFSHPSSTNDVFEFLHFQTKEICIYDKKMVRYAKLDGRIPYFNRVFVGHTTTNSVAGVLHPVKYSNLIMMDCGAGWDGRLAIMDIDTEEYWLSERQKLSGRPEGGTE